MEDIQFNDTTFNRVNMQKFMETQFTGEELKAYEKNAFINTIFKECDKEDASGKPIKEGDGELNATERENFKLKLIKELQKTDPKSITGRIYNALISFIMIVDSNELNQKVDEEISNIFDNDDEG